MALVQRHVAGATNQGLRGSPRIVGLAASVDRAPNALNFVIHFHQRAGADAFSRSFRLRPFSVIGPCHGQCRIVDERYQIAGGGRPERQQRPWKPHDHEQTSTPAGSLNQRAVGIVCGNGRSTSMRPAAVATHALTPNAMDGPPAVHRAPAPALAIKAPTPMAKS